MRQTSELLKALEYHYYSKRYSNTKEEDKKDNIGVNFYLLCIRNLVL